MIASLGIVLQLSQNPKVENKYNPVPTVLEIAPEPNFDRDVLSPLRVIQQHHADEIAADLKATADRVKDTGSYDNSYAWHQCTWYVASRINVPAYMGNANQWAGGLVSAGYREGSPRPGAIATTSLGWAGHVALVEAVSGDMVKISEYNYVPFTYSERWVSKNEFSYFY